MVEPRVEVRGLEETVRAFKELRGETPRGLAKAMKRIADHVVGVAQQRMPFRTGEAERSLKPKGTVKGAVVLYPKGGTPWQTEKADYYPWLDYGGAVGKGRSVKRPVVKGGRYLYPAIGESRGFISDAVDDVMERLIKGEGFDTSGHV